MKISLCNTQFCCRKLRYIECVPQAREFPRHQHVNHLFVKWPNVWLLHKQLIQMLVHGCVGRSETQTIDEGDEGQVCPCWCVEKGPFLPCQHGQSCWKVLLMKFMRGMDYKASRCGVADASLHHHKWGHIVAPLGVVQRCISSNRGKEKILYFLIPPCAFK